MSGLINPLINNLQTISSKTSKATKRFAVFSNKKYYSTSRIEGVPNLNQHTFDNQKGFGFLTLFGECWVGPEGSSLTFSF